MHTYLSRPSTLLFAGLGLFPRLELCNRRLATIFLDPCGLRLSPVIKSSQTVSLESESRLAVFFLHLLMAGNHMLGRH
jgi:hypothetical protein